ncbi:Meiotic Sister-Chromatid recombination aldehyde dehydrogenase [Nowakowskiella sp. JEL0407]|nr:Meiotic Sister-Chromatid recombination aldehyde dehydrogenase [Nowakowskiella sp. JEL0407]
MDAGFKFEVDHVKEIPEENWLRMILGTIIMVVVLGVLPRVYDYYLGEMFRLEEFFKFTKRIKVDFPKEISPDWTDGKIFENPDVVNPTDKSIINCYDPSTGRSLGTAKAHSAAEMKEIVAKARIAQQQYVKTDFETRRNILRSILRFIVDYQKEIAAVCSRDSGKTAVDAGFGEILVTCERLRWTIFNGEKYLKRDYRTSGLMTIYKTGWVEYVPVGVMGCIVSWNYPFHNTFGPIVSAIMAGNACVVKPSEHVAWSVNFFESVLHKILKEHDVSTDLIRIVNGWADAGEALVETADKVIFIGSPQVGRLVMRKASETLTPVILELGGKDAAIVFDSATFSQFFPALMRGAFQNAGQNCAGLERVVIQRKIAERFVEEAAELIGNFRVGSSLEQEVDVGAMVMKSSIPKIQALIDDAVSKGAVVKCGGKPYKHPRYPKGQYYEPTLLVGVTPDMKIAHEEIFGPVLCVYIFDTEDEAVKIANQCGFGLGSGVFSGDIIQARQVSAAVKCGMMNINDFGTNYLIQGLPFGGVKESGFDRFAGIEGIRGQCHLKASTEDAFHPFVKTYLPKPIMYPTSKNSREFMNALIRTLYSPGVFGVISGAIDLIKGMTK